MVRRIGSLLGLGAVVLAMSACGSQGHAASSARTSRSPAGTSTSTSTQSGDISVKLAGTLGGARPSIVSVDRFPKGLRQAARARLAGMAGLSLPDKLQTLANTVLSFWTMEFQGAQVQLTPATLNLIESTPVACGATQVATSDPPVYCATNESVNLPVAYIQSNIAPIGDAALALLVSDVYGYHIENVLGELAPTANLSPVTLAEMDSCFSGTFFYYLQALKELGPGDEAAVNKLLASTTAISSTAASAGSPAAEQLTSAFDHGILSNGNAAVCVPGRGGGGGTGATG